MYTVSNKRHSGKDLDSYTTLTLSLTDDQAILRGFYKKPRQKDRHNVISVWELVHLHHRTFMNFCITTASSLYPKSIVVFSDGYLDIMDQMDQMDQKLSIQSWTLLTKCYSTSNQIIILYEELKLVEGENNCTRSKLNSMIRQIHRARVICVMESKEASICPQRGSSAHHYTSCRTLPCFVFHFSV